GFAQARQLHHQSRARDGGGHRSPDRPRARDGRARTRRRAGARSPHRRRGGGMSAARQRRLRIDDAAAFGRVAVLLGGRSSEREVSLETGKAVLAALQSRGVDAEGWDPAERGWRDFAHAGFDRAWIALHGPGGEDGALQGALQWLEMPYTGSGVKASALAMDKVRSKLLFGAAAIGTPAAVVIEQPSDAVVAAHEL